MNLFDTLKDRNLLYQTTDEEALKKLMNDGKITVYSGTDPTADSLHLGHCIPCTILRRFQQAGHKVIILVGGATAAIGDPTGKTNMRPMLSKEQLNHNIEGIKRAYSKFLDFDGDNPAIIVNNSEWFNGYDYIDFMRDVGVHFNVNKMITNEIYAKRIEEGGLTFYEMGYMLMQAYDFLHLNEKYGCNLQWGGADQWGNIVAGTELGRKLNFLAGNDDPRTFQALTSPLLTDHNGKKMGKTSKGALWISKDKTSPYEFYQYFLNVDDKDVVKLLKLFTNYYVEDIEELASKDIRAAKQLMAYEITKLIHGEKDANEAVEASKALFGGGADLSNAPTVEVSKQELENGIRVLEVALRASLVPSFSEGRRLVVQGAIVLNDEKITNPNELLKAENFAQGYAILKKGKKNLVKIDLV